MSGADAVSALVLGAGSGERFGRSKAFLTADGETLVERAVRLVAPVAAEVLVGLHPQDVERGSALLAGGRARVMAGGATRHDTVRILLGHATGPLVLLHEVARPFVTPDLVAGVLDAARRHGAAALYTLASERDAVALRDGDTLVQPLRRAHVVRTQTPNAFRRTLLLDAYDAVGDRAADAESTSALVALAGHPVHLVPGRPDNRKITLPEDWPPDSDSTYGD